MNLIIDKETGEIRAQVTNSAFCQEMTDFIDEAFIASIREVVKCHGVVKNGKVLACFSYLIAEAISGDNMSHDAICVLAQDVGEYMHATAHLIHETQTNELKSKKVS